MKKNANNLFFKISTENLATLTNVVDETLAIKFSHQTNKVFTTADLWNIQRQAKTRKERRISA